MSGIGPRKPTARRRNLCPWNGIRPIAPDHPLQSDAGFPGSKRRVALGSRRLFGRRGTGVIACSCGRKTNQHTTLEAGWSVPSWKRSSDCVSAKVQKVEPAEKDTSAATDSSKPIWKPREII